MPRADIDAEEIRRHVIVASPGSRNAPLLVAAARENAIEVIPVADERSAAFIALGYAAVSDAPVAIICTSGTAVLNYGPALPRLFTGRCH